MDLTKNHIKLIKDYIKLVKKTGMYPGRAELDQIGYSRDNVRHYFSNLENLKQAAITWAEEHDPEAFAEIIDDSIFTPKQFKQLKDEVKKYKRLVVTTAVVGAPVHEGFLESIQKYCEHKDAKLLVLPAADPASAGNWVLDK